MSLLGQGGGVDPDAARERARDILDRREFEPAQVPRPLRGVLEWIGDRLDPVLDVIERATRTALGRTVLFAVLALVVGLVAWLVVRRRGSLDVADGGSRRRRRTREDPDELERTARLAEASGDLERGIRLRFRAGLLRLDAAGAIELRPSATSGEVGARLRLTEFDEVAMLHDIVVYGGRPASPDDVERTRTGWPRVLAAATR